MKPTDIISEVPLYPETTKDVVSQMRGAGYKEKGSGIDARVYRHPEDKKNVIKVLIGDSGRATDMASEGFLKFYKFVKKHPNHPNLPKFGEPYTQVYGTKPHQETVYFVPVEKLISLGDKEGAFYTVLLNQAAKKKTFNKSSFEDGLKSIKQSAEFFKIRRDYYHQTLSAEMFSMLSDLNKDTTRSKQKLAKLKELYDITVKIGDYARAVGANLDLHAGNMMKRSDGTIVITDPYISD